MIWRITTAQRQHRKAIHYLRLAAEQAMKRSAHGEAAGQFTVALELLQRISERSERDRAEIAIRLTWPMPRLQTGGRVFERRRIDSLERARGWCRDDDDASLLEFWGACVPLWRPA